MDHDGGQGFESNFLVIFVQDMLLSERRLAKKVTLCRMMRESVHSVCGARGRVVKTSRLIKLVKLRRE